MSYIVISGTARSGKDTLADLLIKRLSRFVKIAYADALKEQVMEDFELTWTQLYGDLKEVPDSRYKKDGGGFWTPREIMQFIGTDAYRHIDSMHWVNKLFSRAEDGGYDDVIIPDGRFSNEIMAVKDRGGIHIRIHRDHSIFVNNSSHSSETALDKFELVDYYVNNNWNKKALNKHVEKIVKIIGEG